MSTDIKRKDLINIAALVKPALASAAYIPALTHIMFDGKRACAFNDVAAIWVNAQFGYEGCLPGELFIKALNSFKGDTVGLDRLNDGQTLITSGRSKIKLPTMEVADYPQPKLKLDKAWEIVIDPDLIKGIRSCLISVNDDKAHPAQMGVTLDADLKGNALLFSTDNVTISRYKTTTAVELPNGAPIILPTFFCQMLIELWSVWSEDAALYIGADFIAAEFGDNATLFSRVIADLEPMEFEPTVARIIDPASVKKKSVTIPDQWEAAFERAMLVLSGEVVKATHVKLKDGKLALESDSAMGTADDRMEFDDKDAELNAHVDPQLILRGSKAAAAVAFTPKATVLSSEKGEFIHIIAHTTK